MADGAADIGKALLANPHGLLHCGVVGNEASGNRQSRLIERDSGNVGGGQFVDEAITVLVSANAEAFLGLNSVVLIESVDGELAERNHSASLVKRHDE